MANMRNPDLAGELHQLRRRIERLELGVRVPSVSLVGGGRRSVSMAQGAMIETVPVAPGLPQGPSWITFLTTTLTVPAWATTAQVLAITELSAVITTIPGWNLIEVRALIGSEASESGAQSVGAETTGAMITYGHVGASMIRSYDGGLPPTIPCRLQGRGHNDTPTSVPMGAISVLATFGD